MFNIRTFNAIAARGLERFDAQRYVVGPQTDNADGIVLRSHKLALEEIPASVQAIARAGAGVNNVPVEGCTDRGVVVFNTPGANANSVKELVLTALLLASRDVYGGMQFVSSLAQTADEGDLNKTVEALEILYCPQRPGL